MKRTLLIAGTAAVALAGSLYPAAHAATPRHAAKASHVKPAASQTMERFTLVGTNDANHANSHAITSGLFTAGGIDHQTNNNNDLLRLGNGTLKIHHPGGKAKFHQSKNCLVNYVVRGKYTLGGGTGAYAGVTGHGKYRGTFSFVLPKKSNGKCNEKGSPRGFESVITAHGPASRSS